VRVQPELLTRESSAQDFAYAGDVVRTSANRDVGLTCYYDENSYLKLAWAVRNGQVGVLAAEYVDEAYVSEEFVPVSSREIIDRQDIELRIVTEGLKRSCYYRVQKEWCHIATFENTAYLSSEGLSKGKRFTGAMTGIYVHGNVAGVFEDFVLE